jgi:hypothetical protein
VPQRKRYDFAVWGTQGGGLARLTASGYVFVEPPDEVHNLKVGDGVPLEWDMQPANTLARNASNMNGGQPPAPKTKKKRKDDDWKQHCDTGSVATFGDILGAAIRRKAAQQQEGA